MRDVVILFVHVIVTVVRLALPGGLRSVVAESVLVKHQLLILNRGLSTRKTSGESDLGAALQCGSRIKAAREPTTRSLLLSIQAMVPMSCLHFISFVWWRNRL